MEKKTYTFLITSNRKGETKTFTLSDGWLKLGFLSGIIVVALASAVLVDYLGLLLQEGENKKLKAENIQLSKQFHVVESKVQALESSLERLKSMTTKIKLITDIENSDRTLKLSLGKMPKPGQNLDADYMGYKERDMSQPSSMLDPEEVFTQKTPVNAKKYELAKYTNKNYATLSIRVERDMARAKLVEQGILKLQNVLTEKQSLLSATPSMKPARGWVASKFGYRLDPLTGRPTMNNGIDIAAPQGTPVYAPADGKVSLITYDTHLGKVVVVDHGYGVTTKFAHNSQIFVEQGQLVKRKDVIAAVGNTGRTTGPALHYEVRVHGIPVDPTNYILQ